MVSPTSHESDMLLMPDAETAVIDPVCKIPTLSIICDVAEPISGERYKRDPRYIAQKAEAFVKSSGIAVSAYFGPELEFFVFDSVSFDQNQHSGYYFVDSEEGIWNSGATWTARTWVTARGTRKAISRSRRPIPCRT